MRWSKTIVHNDSDEAEFTATALARCRAQMARPDSQLARGEAASVSARGIAAIHKMLPVGLP